MCQKKKEKQERKQYKITRLNLKLSRNTYEGEFSPMKQLDYTYQTIFPFVICPQ